MSLSDTSAFENESVVVAAGVAGVVVAVAAASEEQAIERKELELAGQLQMTSFDAFLVSAGKIAVAVDFAGSVVVAVVVIAEKNDWVAAAAAGT